LKKEIIACKDRVSGFSSLRRIMNKRIYFETFGCQMNKLDADIIKGLLLESGCQLTKNVTDADVILFNTCSVRRHAEEKVYSRLGALKALKKKRPELIIGVLGCMAQSQKQMILKRAPFVDLICGTGGIYDIPELLDALNGQAESVISAEMQDLSEKTPPIAVTQTPYQAYVAIMRGCDNFCSYCVVPYVRGREFSRSPESIVDEVRRLAGKGIKEITLLGQNIDSYGKHTGGKWSLAGLLCLLQEVEGIRRIRFITSHPKDLTDDVLFVMRDLSKVCEYLHLPIQSGSDKILKAMKRGYTSRGYLEIIEKARAIVPEIAVSSDFIVGFPGETEEDFAASRDIMRKVRFKNSFIFKYSPRETTEAFKLKDDVPLSVKKERNRELLELQKTISLEDNRKFAGRTFEILVEGRSKKDATKLTGRTRTGYITVFEGAPDLAGSFVNVKITGGTDITLFGELADEKK